MRTIAMAGLAGVILLLVTALAQDGATKTAGEGPPERVVGVSISDVLQSAPELQAFRVALHGTPLADRLDRAGGYTLFAPVDAAFSYLSHGDLEALLGEGAEERLAGFLVEDALTPDALRAMLRARGGEMTLPTLAGGQLGLALDAEGAVVVGGVARTGAWYAAANGVVVVIENVLRGW